MSLGIAAKRKYNSPGETIISLSSDAPVTLWRSHNKTQVTKTQKNHERKFFCSPAVINDHHQRDKHHCLLLLKKATTKHNRLVVYHLFK